MASARVIFSLLFGLLLNLACHQQYECLSMQSEIDGTLPNPSDSLDTTFWLHTRSTPSPVQLNLVQKSSETFLVDRKKLVVIGHGFRGNSSKSWIQPMVNALLRVEDMNIIVVDWENGAAPPYPSAVANSRLVGREISSLLKKLLAQKDLLQPSDIHLIGFSLGAHLVGFAGKNLREEGLLVGRITGLDPAGPLFEKAEKDSRLDKDDAQFVDIIHTDTRTFYFAGLGIKKAIGNIDFYPNGGFFQPGCQRLTLDLLASGGGLDDLGCSHARAVEYFIESILNKDAFEAYQCSTYEGFKRGTCKENNGKIISNNMGFHVDKTSGTFFLKTNAERPFSGHHYLLTVTTGTKFFSGTFAKLQVKLYGMKGASADTETESRLFKAGETQSLIIHTDKDLGDISKVEFTLVHTSWLTNAWYVTKVTVNPLWNTERYVGCEKLWIDKDTEMIHVKKESTDSKC